MVALYFSKETSILFSIVVVPIFIHYNSEEGFLFYTPSLAFIICRLFDDGCSDWCDVITHCSFGLCFSNNCNVKHQFMCFLTIWISPLWKWLFKCPAYFLTVIFCLFVCLYWATWAVCKFWRLILVGHIIPKYFLPFFLLSFHFVYGFLCWAKTFEFDYVSLVYFCVYFHCYGRCFEKYIAVICIREGSAYFFFFVYSNWFYNWSLIHSEFIFLYDIIECSDFFFFFYM